MLCKLAWGNVRRAGHDYLVYLLTLTLAVIVFYAFNTVSIQIDFATMEQGLSELLGGIIRGLTVFLALVMGFLMVYANNFIMKRRKKEFGLYQVLGMSRGQVSRIMALETAIVSGCALVLGIAFGVALSWLMTFFTASLFKAQISGFHFFFSVDAFLWTAGCLVTIFLVTLLFNLRVVRRAKIIDLMHAERQNELIKVRNPWISALLFMAGVVLIGVAYYRLLRDGLPVDAVPEELDTKMLDFWITTLMVTIGTILFFFGLSGFLLKVLQSVRALYWRGLNMVTMRQLSAKVNTVSFSMAVIAMILFLAITSVTGGMSIASAMNSNLERWTPADYCCTLIYYRAPSSGEDSIGRIAADEGETTVSEPVDLFKESANNTIVSTGEPFDLSRIASKHVQTNFYDSTPDDSSEPLISLNDLCLAADLPLPVGMENADSNTMGLMVIKESNYNEYLKFRGMDTVDLGSDGYLLTCDIGSTITGIYDQVMHKGTLLEMGTFQLHPKADQVDIEASAFMISGMGGNSGTIVVPDEVVDACNLPLYVSDLLVDYKKGLPYGEAEQYVQEKREYNDPSTSEGKVYGLWGVENTRLEAYEGANNMNGLVSYLAIYIGFVLVVACAAILSIQQLSGVADSGKNCRILSELGIARREIMHSVLVQQAIFFCAPLVVGIAHSLVALRVVIEIVELFGGLSIGGTVGMTCAIFLLSYGGYFLVAYAMSKGIVRDAISLRHAA